MNFNLNMIILSYEYDYIGLFIFLIVSIIIALLLFIVAYFISPKNIYAEKLSAYECGFEPFNEARETFDIHFYIVAILFIIFDLEVAFLFPWAVSLNEMPILGFWSMVIFLLLLTIGFVYEWKRGALDWSVTYRN